MAALAAAAYFFGRAWFPSFEWLAERQSALQGLVEAHPVLAPLAYVLLYAALVVGSIPGGTVMSVAGGVLFGTVLGTACAVLGATGGAGLLFLLVQPLAQGISAFAAIQTGLGALARIEEVLALPEESGADVVRVRGALGHAPVEVRLEGVSFSFPDPDSADGLRAPVLVGTTFTAPAGRRTAIVGGMPRSPQTAAMAPSMFTGGVRPCSSGWLCSASSTARII